MFKPHNLFGGLGDADLREYDDEGVVCLDMSATTRIEIVEKRGHKKAVTSGSPPVTVPAQYRQIIQVQVFNIGLKMEVKLEPIPAADGSSEGLAAVSPGEHLGAFGNFADGEEIHGFVRDPTKLLLIGEIKHARSPEKPTEISYPVDYLPCIAAPT